MEVKCLGKGIFIPNSHKRTFQASSSPAGTSFQSYHQGYNLSSSTLALITGHLLAGGITPFLIQSSATEWKPSVRF